MSKPFNPKLVIGDEEAQRATVECRSCDNAQFEILLEPGYTDPALAKQFGGKPRVVKFCPFCGGDDLHEV